MRQLFIVLGFIAVVIALILAVTPLSQLAYLPGLAALVFGGIAFYISKRTQSPRKSVQLILLLTLISLVLTTYKSIFSTSEVGNLEELELKEEASIEDSKQLLEELDLEDMDIESDDPDVDSSDNDDLPDLEDLQEE